MACVDLQLIDGDECIGASLPKINGNFAALSAAVCDLSANVPDAAINVFDSPTIDLDWNASTRTLSAVTTSMVATSSSPMVAKAWVTFNASTTVPIISASYNVVSVNKISNGIYNIIFKTNTFADKTYLVTAFGESQVGQNLTIPVGDNTTDARTLSSIKIGFYDSSAGLQNPLHASVLAFSF